MAAKKEEKDAESTHKEEKNTQLESLDEASRRKCGAPI